VCKNYVASNRSDDGRPTFSIETLEGDSDEYITDILKFEGSESNLMLYDLQSAKPADNGRSSFYQISFILGTIHGGINVQSSGDYCATPEGYNSEVENFDYCAINKFSFSAQAIGG
jgi:hypothetical protein